MISSFSRTFWLLILLFIVGLALRFLYFPQNVYFGYDQARDAFISQEIYRAGDIKIQGPPTSTEGIFHGPLLYYLLGFLYSITGGGPASVLIFFILLNSFSIFLFYLLVKYLTNSEKIGLIAAGLFAFSFEQTQWAIFQSNTSLASFGILLFLTGLALFLFQRKGLGLPAAVLGLGIAFQSEIFLGYLVLPAFLVWWYGFKGKPKPGRNIATAAIILLLLFSSTYLASEVLFGFPFSSSIFSAFSTSGASEKAAFGLNTAIDRLGMATHFNVFGFHPFLAFSFLAASLVSLWDKKLKLSSQLRIFLLAFLLGSFILFIFGEGFANIYHLSLGMSFIIIITTALAIGLRARGWVLFVVLAFLVLSQINLIKSHNPNGATITLVQKGMLISDEKKVLDYILGSNPEQVGVTALSNPFKVNTVWSYVFKQYWPKDKALPLWVGGFAQGFQGEEVFTATDVPPCLYFVIHEPADGIPSNLVTSFLELENNRSEKVEEKTFGAIKVEKRSLFHCDNPS